jgi:hypothetical protein
MSKDNAEKKEIETYVPDWAFVTGRLDSTFKMLACPKDKYKEVTINLTPQPKNLGNGRMSHGLNYSIARIDLHNGTYGSASKVFDDATKLAEQIAKRWNEYDSLSADNYQLRDALRWRNIKFELPDYGERVLIETIHFGTHIAWRKYEEYFEGYDRTFENTTIIGWLPIPQLQAKQLLTDNTQEDKK